jgi:hypothetical protein
MTQIQQLWNKRTSPLEEAIFFADDTFAHVEFAEAGVSTFGSRLPLRASSWAADHENVSHHDVYAQAEMGEYVVYVGDGGCEEEGFVAVEKNGELLWWLTLGASEPFSAVEIEGEEIVAKAEIYPHETTLRISLENPSGFRLMKTYNL